VNHVPGIAGLVDVGNTVDTKTLLQQMLDEMKHEEFHLAESFFDPPVGIGRVHLNVEDSCRQPVFSRDQKKCIVMIGEVYSYRNLPDYLNLSAEERDSEPSIVLRLYSEFGLNFVNFLNGSFLLAIWDSDARKMLIANDRYGLFPLYYANFGGVFLFASEVKSILQMKTFPRVLDGRSVADFFSFGYILGNKTLLKDVKVMPPACIFVADGRKNQVDIEKYWDLGFKEDKRIDLQNAGKTFHTLLKISVSRQIPKKIRLRSEWRNRFKVNFGSDREGSIRQGLRFHHRDEREF
jgi:asparagine synthase (glutamine-hydrolysing)